MYDNSLKIKDALQLYFSKYHFKDGGYNLKWFKIKLGALYIPVPNIKARIDAVKFHDIHHVITGYEATYKGEAQIGGWEIASGCGPYYVAWILNLGSFLIGLFLYPKSLFNAFMKGRKCITNLYHNTIYDDVLLNKTVGEVRSMIEPNLKSKDTLKDYILFFVSCIFALCYHLALIALIIFLFCRLF